jgi:hypothetical protein
VRNTLSLRKLVYLAISLRALAGHTLSHLAQIEKLVG